MPAPSGSYRAALRIRDFRLQIVSFLIDSIGSWAYNVVLVVYVFQRTGSPTWVSVFMTSSWLTKMLLAPYAGLLADRHERTRLMRVSASASFVVMSVLAFLVYADAPLPLLLLAAAGTSVCVSPYNPAAQALLVDAVDEANLPAANALFLTTESLVIVVGPALGGLLLLTGEPALAIAINAATFLVTVALVSAIRTRSRGGADEEVGESKLRRLTAGARALRAEPVALVLVLYCLLGTAAAATTVVFFVQLSQQLGTGTEGYSWLLATFSVGGVLAATVTNRLAAGRVAAAVLTGMLMLSVPFLLVIWVENAVLGNALQVVSGAGMVIVDVLAITALQRQMPRTVLGRVFALLETGAYAAMVLGSFATAALLEATGLGTTLLILGLVFAVVSVAAIGPLLRADRENAAAVAALQPRIALLRRLDLFAAAARPALEAVARAMEDVQAAAGDVLIRQGDSADALYVLRTGSVQVSALGEDGVPRALTTLGPDSYFGEIGLLRGIPRTATVVAAEACQLYRIDAETFLTAIQGGQASSSLLGLVDVRLFRSRSRLVPEPTLPQS
ncbi:MAG: MFS transporter [Geodermatophilaceae bacterium]|nr:MFS transporter [Geodermatophilaceae bacterium]